MPRHISWRKLVQRFRELGYDGPYSGGRHLFMVKDTLKVRIPNPHHGDISGACFRGLAASRHFSKRMEAEKINVPALRGGVEP